MQARSLYITEHPDMSGPFAQAIMAGQIMIGMTPEMVQAAWGRPQRVENRRTPEGNAVSPAGLTPADTGAVGEAAREKAARAWDLKLVYGNYLMNRMVSNLFFEAGHLKLIENVDTNGASAVSMSDPGARILLPGQAPPQSGPAKGGGQIQ